MRANVQTSPYPLPVTAADGMPIADRARLLLMSDTLDSNERYWLDQWTKLEPGNYYKPNIRVDRIGIRIYGRQAWAATVGRLYER